ncbi:hypothetical protein LTR35_012146 [Friedmanniomyces endolithicus]|nr:hypothetical protein LTR35_012146 [Friedmanniomyces endolithicus]KAK0284398.1 hypothetical protein LTS00_011355 [Friedmanniomyces endolithicus]KAK0996020.1 hypothetical protein LTR54_010314 [Friedmanniomyces endolithicus]KAK1008896.1 hypothetical protein LTS01_002169 [Friedmanniomyces endolithicus]
MSAFQQQQQQHLRSDSSDTSSYGSTGSAGSTGSSGSGSSYQLILDHILTYPGSYEIPLRTMYTLNCAPRVQPMPNRHGASSSTSSSPTHPQGPWHDNQATQTFTESLMTQISQLPNQPSSLPPHFITSFVLRCFPSDLLCVDFPQALTGLDYLKDLETRRRREVAGAMSRLAIDRTTLELDGDSLSDRYPGVKQWVGDINEKERKVEALYTQVYVALRRWILVNEMALLPFSKHNCIAMLNTLYPPAISTPPTSKLTPAVLQKQRQGFFKYILSVEQKGPHILTTLMDQGKVAGEVNGWHSVTRTLGMYLQLANSVIVECAEIVDVQDVSTQKTRVSTGSRTARKVDSGVSFNGSEQLSRRGSSNGETISPLEPPPRPKTPSGFRNGTTLEKLARGLKGIGRSRTDVTEMVDIPAHPPPPPSPGPDRTRGLRKMRSLGSLDSRKTSPKLPDAPSFDADVMRLHRMKYEAGNVAEQKFGRRQHHEV